LINLNSDKLSGSHKHADTTTTAAPGHGEASTFGGNNSSLDTTAGTTGSSTYGNEGTTGESMLRQNNTGLGSSGTSSGTTSQYGADGQRKKGLGEKAKDAVGLDPKDGRDPKDIGYGNTSTGYNQGSSSATGSSSSYGTSGSTSEYGADGQRKKGLGEKAKEAVGLDPKDGRDPKDIGYGNTSSNQDVDRQTTRLGQASLGDSERHIGSNHHHAKRSVQTAAPVVAERIHDQYENIDKTRVEELHDRTEVTQTVQPIYDERTEATQRSRQDHGLEVHEHGKAGLDTRTEAELAAKREQISRDHRSTHDETTTERSLRPDVDVQSRTTVVEEVRLTDCLLTFSLSLYKLYTLHRLGLHCTTQYIIGHTTSP
jgi:hypothetical protein